MRIKLDTHTYQIDWQHAHFTSQVCPDTRDAIVHGSTTCVIGTVTHSLGGTVSYSELPDLTSTAFCSVKDVFSKPKGRKESLRRSLAKWGLPKEQRRRIWQVLQTVMAFD